MTSNITKNMKSSTSKYSAEENLMALFHHIAQLYTCAACSSLSEKEASDLLASICFVMNIPSNHPEDAESLASTRVLDEFHRRKALLDTRAYEAVKIVEQINEIMLPIHNIALRDTLVSLHCISKQYDTVFAAHEVPCIIDYQLFKPVPENLQGIDYIESYLSQLLWETRALQEIGLDACVERLEARCPDYCGLHVNLYDLCRRPL